MVLVYAVVFPFILRVQEENYLIFLIVGIIPWTFFTNIINYGVTAVLRNANIIKKVYFPREILPISVVTSGLVNFLISCFIILIFVLISGVGLSWHLLLLPIVILVQYVFSLGLVFILSAIEVYIRDVEYIMNFVVMMLFYVTPIVYSISLIPNKYQWILYLNPMTTIINSYRDIFYYHQVPNLLSLLIVGAFSVIFSIIGYSIFKKLERGFAEEV
jgi:ABC-type polysaccharide/polyol phosphate export permease